MYGILVYISLVPGQNGRKYDDPYSLLSSEPGAGYTGYADEGQGADDCGHIERPSTRGHIRK